MKSETAIDDGIRRAFEESVAAKKTFLQESLVRLRTVVDLVAERMLAGNKLMLFGNGGSAADAQHAVTELVGRFARERRAIAAVALTADSAVVSAVANDYGFERVFARQIEALGAPGDVALAISTSGASANVLAGVDAARAAGLVVVALTGRDGGALGRAADIHVNVPEQSAARAQEVHRTLLHILCELVERELDAR